MSKRLEGRTALVTGASSGLGAHFAKLMAAEGAHVVAAARRKDRLETLVDDITSSGGDAIAIGCDVEDEASIIACYDEAQAAFGAVDTIICNAGLDQMGLAVDISADDFDKVMNVNVRGVFLTAREGAKRLIGAGEDISQRGRIVTIASIAGLRVLPGQTAYSTSKAAVLMMTESLAREWARYGICVNAICPGFIETEINSDWLKTDKGQAMLKSMPRRRVMDIECLNDSILYLSSDGARFTTGAHIKVDDGQSI
ncbi:MAG: glucose 1-dehydrogenase [Pseudomonadota bacterium]